MRKLLKSAKAMSPVVAAIILIAVTVAVSIAVAAWMGALTFTFMAGAEELKITGHTWDTNSITLTVANTGTSTLNITTAWVGDYKDTVFTPLSLDPGESGTVTITASGNFEVGRKYQFSLVTKAGNKYGYMATAPT